MKTMFVINGINYSHLKRELIESINDVVENSNEEISLCVKDATKQFCDILTAVYSIKEIDGFYDGVLCATTIRDAKTILSSCTNAQKVLFLYDLEWMFDAMQYDELYSILSNPDLFLITRSEEYTDPIYKLCGRQPDAILEHLCVRKLWNLLEKTKT